MSCPRSTTSTESAANLFAGIGFSASCCVSSAAMARRALPFSPLAFSNSKGDWSNMGPYRRPFAEARLGA